MMLPGFQLFARNLLAFIDQRPGGRKNDRDPRARDEVLAYSFIRLNNMGRGHFTPFIDCSNISSSPALHREHIELAYF